MRLRHSLWIASLAGVSLLACLSTPAPGPLPCDTGWPESLNDLSQEDLLARGSELFGTHCAVCHGEAGRGDGRAAAHLFPPARDFASGRFRLVRTTNRVPLEADLVRTLERGMPGSAMPSWSWLPIEDLWSLATYVLELSKLGQTEHLMATEGLDETSAYARVDSEWEPGLLFNVGSPVQPTPAILERGRASYEQNCAACHGTDGRGPGTGPKWNEDGSLNWARDFTAGFLKGDVSHADLAYRVLAGLPGSAMPGTELSPDELGPLVAYVRTLIPPGSEARLVQLREKLTAKRTAQLPSDAQDDQWSDAEEIRVVLAPLWWRDTGVRAVELAAMHDGREIVVRARWADESGLGRVFAEGCDADALALQFSNAAAPPLFGMGSASQPTTLWHWRALDPAKLESGSEPGTGPHATFRVAGAQPDVPLYRPRSGSPQPGTNVQTQELRGAPRPGSPATSDSSVEAHPDWRAGEWRVVFRRPLALASSRDVVFEPGGEVQVAVAVWNGAAGDRGPQKSISIWHALALEP